MEILCLLSILNKKGIPPVLKKAAMEFVVVVQRIIRDIVLTRGWHYAKKHFPVDSGQRVGGMEKLPRVNFVANKGLYREEYTCSTSCLFILQFTHDMFQAFGSAFSWPYGLTLHSALTTSPLESGELSKGRV